MVVNIPKKIDFLDVLKTILIVYIIYVIYQIVKRGLGGSWGFEALIIAILIANLGYSFYISAQLQRHLGKHSIFDKQFSSLCKDFKELKNKR